MKGRQDFADQLDATYQDLLLETNTETLFKAIFDRLPVYCHEGWVRRVMGIERKGKSRRLENMLPFVQNRAKALNHVVYATRTAGSNYSSKSRQAELVLKERCNWVYEFQHNDKSVYTS